MMYKSSKGEVEIATMPLSYAKNALNKLRRTEPERTAEIEALDAHVSKLEAEAIEKNLTPKPREAVIGDNGGPPVEDEQAPAPEGRKAVEIHVADLLVEASNWADGAAIENQDQAATVGKLHRMLQEAAALVNDTAAKEKKPLNDALAEIATWQNSYTAKGLKKTPDGALTKAVLATGNLSAAWLRKQDEARKERGNEAAAAAAKAAQEAIALREEAKVSTDLEQMDRAEDALAAAKNLIRMAESVGKEKVQVGGGEGFRAVGLRSVYSAVPSGEPGAWGAAYAHYKTNPEFMADFHALLQRWADRDVRNEATRVRGIPGFRINEEKVAA
ncbi:hypothetical protein [Novosphingobium sp. M1R2S20]|uniref:Uncharacterized protein n=1 Tax=Novosphingobium rhizovicinum TaxID=3228928 RepID=A0ABV3RCR4_9SPHN